MFKYLKWYQNLIIFVLLFGSVFLFLNLFPVKTNIDREVEGIRWDAANTAESENVMITIEGQYVKYFMHCFKDDSFQGMITLSCYPFTQKDDCFLFPVNFRHDYYAAPFEHGISMGDLIYMYNADSPTASTRVSGTIFQKEPLTQGIIKLTEESSMKIVSFPCQNREEAAALAEELLQSLPEEIQELVLYR